jgi:hypothetical protein
MMNTTMPTASTVSPMVLPTPGMISRGSWSGAGDGDGDSMTTNTMGA